MSAGDSRISSGVKLGVVVVSGVLILGVLVVASLGFMEPGESPEQSMQPNASSSSGGDNQDSGSQDSGSNVNITSNVDRDTVEQNSSNVTNEELVSAFRDSLLSSGVRVEELEINDEVLRLDYRSRRTNQSVVRGEIEVVMGYYASIVEEGLDVRMVNATILDMNQSRVAYYKVRTVWAESMLNGSISKNQYASRVIGSLRSVE